jgi:hypothetical protein
MTVREGIEKSELSRSARLSSTEPDHVRGE